MKENNRGTKKRGNGELPYRCSWRIKQFGKLILHFVNKLVNETKYLKNQVQKRKNKEQIEIDKSYKKSL